jgi:hypothetical protein
MLLSAVSVLVVAQSISEIPDGLMNNPVYYHRVASEINPSPAVKSVTWSINITVLFKKTLGSHPILIYSNMTFTSLPTQGRSRSAVWRNIALAIFSEFHSQVCHT